MAIDSLRRENAWRYFWGTWAVFLLMALFLFENVWFDRAVWLAFLPVELYAALDEEHSDDTLSEFMQWIDSWAKPQARWYQSWQGLVSFMVFIMGIHAGQVVSIGWDQEVHTLYAWGLPFIQYGNNVLMGALAALCIWGFLLWHFVRSDKTG